MGGSIFSAPTQSLNLTPKTSLSAHTPATSTFPSLDPGAFVSYDGFYNWNTLNAEDTSSQSGGAQHQNPTMGTGAGAGGLGVNTHVGDDSMNNFPLPTNNFSWQNMPMDIDQDWSWFLNDNQTQGLGTERTLPVGQGTMDAFATGFTGFG